MILINHEYHVVELGTWIPDEVLTWLHTKFGPGDGTRWLYRNKRLLFADRRDHLMFILTWGDK